MRFEPFYTVTFTAPEAWSVEVASDAGIEGRDFLLAEGRSIGRLSARFRAANFPRKRADGAAILFEWQGLAVLTDYPPVERVDYSVIADLVCIVPLLILLIHRSA